MKKKKIINNKIVAVILGLVLVVSSMLTACTIGDSAAIIATPDSGVFEKIDSPATEEPEYTATEALKLDSDDVKVDFSETEMITITLSDDEIDVSGIGVAVTGSTVTILQSGTYSISGSMSDGQIIVNSEDEGTVFLILDGVDINSSNSAAIYVLNAKKTVISLADGTDNYLSDGVSHVFADTEDEEPDSVLFSEDDLVINGSGSLTIDVNYKHGIVSKDDLIIISGNITITAVSDGIRGRDSIVIAGGNIDITADNDGMQSNNDKDTEKGYILIEGGIINIESGNDGIQAETNIVVNDGEINILSGGGTQNIVVAEDVNEQTKDSSVAAEETESTKGIKAVSLIQINGGIIDIDSHDDAIHSDNVVEINNGTLTLSTDDDGIHADNSIIINDGNIDIENCNEAIEGTVLTVNGGEIRMNASDDGFNASDGTGSAGMPGNEIANGDCALYINGGYIVIYSNADSVDSNGIIYMTGGTVIANGPQSYTNGALDSDGEFIIEGGVLIAVGSSGMAESPDGNSSQNSVLYLFDTVQAVGTMIYIVSEDDEQLLAYNPVKEYQSIAFSSPELETGKTYTVYSGGSIDSQETDGVHEDGNYSTGTVVGEFTVNSALTVVGTQSRQQGGPQGGGPPAGGKRP